MAEQVRRFLTLTNTQGGADTFNQASLATDIIPENGFVYKVTGIDVQFSSHFHTLAADCWVNWSLSRDSKTAAGAVSDPDIMISDGFSFAMVTSGVGVLKDLYRYENLQGIYIVDPTIYTQLGSGATGNANVCTWRIYYEEVKMNEIDILRILNNT